MNEPQLYQRYDRHQAVAFFGEEAKAKNLCDGQWLIFSETAICLATIGQPPKNSHFDSGSSFFWVADKPYHVSGDKFNHFVPTEVIGGEAKSRSIRLFVQPKNSETFMYVGELGPSFMQQLPGPQNHGMARFEVKPTLPSAVWMQLGGLRVGDTDVASVDRALDQLRTPTTVDDRLGVLRRLVEYWHGPIRPEDGMSETLVGSVNLPRPLKWWYGWAGRRREIMSGQNMLLSPEDKTHKYLELHHEDDRLLFYLENQAVYRWATLDQGDDPPVFGRYEMHDAWESEGIKLSEHLILASIFEAVMSHSPYGASAACLEKRALTKIEEVITPIAVPPWRWLGPTHFYARNGAFMYSMSNGTDVYSVWIGAKTEGPLQFLKPYLDNAWEYTAV